MEDYLIFLYFGIIIGIPIILFLIVKILEKHGIIKPSDDSTGPSEPYCECVGGIGCF